MAVVTIGRLSEECLKMLSGGDIQLASNVSLNEMKIAIGQVVNNLLRVEHFEVNEALGEKIPNGSVLGLYEGISVSTWNNKSKATLPIKPIKLPRNMGVWSIYPSGEPDKEFIPLQMGQSSLLKSQRLINDLLGQIGYEVYGDSVVFTKNLLSGRDSYTVDMRLVIMDISQYGDYDMLPILPEQEWRVKQEVIKLYSTVGVADMLVDSGNKQQQNIPVREQKQTP